MSSLTTTGRRRDRTFGNRTLIALDCRIESIVHEFKASAVWRTLIDPCTPAEHVLSILREVYWEVHCYHPWTTYAGFAMLGRINPDELRVMRTLLLHKWDEVEHRVWALDGYKAFGGDPQRIGREAEFMSPGAFAVAAVWERLAIQIDPLAYLGAEYLFEDLTARLAKDAVAALRSRTLSAEGMRFIVDHAEEDIKHSALLKRLISEVSARKPELHAQVLYAFDCFQHVYPMPLWNGSYERAMRGATEAIWPTGAVGTSGSN